ncbi:hypothetical protein ACWXWB_04600 [Pantoea dispersa]|uniref:hypothetical protein n=1 Tax=Pantoea dispersa TaxID=59814 RepID=UPI002DBCEF3D|nr:hypothetical protein [Pantoea dispersa]MEB5972564.1 hypothetical protein [Pantoea dispersa]
MGDVTAKACSGNTVKREVTVPLVLVAVWLVRYDEVAGYELLLAPVSQRFTIAFPL